MNKQDEYYHRLRNVIAEGRFTKQLQWNSLYYSLLLYAGIITLYQVETKIPYEIYILSKIVTISLVAFISLLMVKYQISHVRTLDECRTYFHVIEFKKLHNQLYQELEYEYINRLSIRMKAKLSTRMPWIIARCLSDRYAKYRNGFWKRILAGTLNRSRNVAFGVVKRNARIIAKHKRRIDYFDIVRASETTKGYAIPFIIVVIFGMIATTIIIIFDK